MFKKRSKILFIANIIATIYFLYTLYKINIPGLLSNSGQEIAISSMNIYNNSYYLIFTCFGVIFGWLGFFLHLPAFIMTAFIMYYIPAFAFLFEKDFLLLPQIILTGVSYVFQKMINARQKLQMQNPQSGVKIILNIKSMDFLYRQK